MPVDAEELAGKNQVAFAIARHQQDLITPPTVDHHRRLTITHEISDRQAMWMRMGRCGEWRVCRRPEASSTVTEQNGDVGRLVISDHQVEIAVPRHVGNGDVIRIRIGRERRARRPRKPPFSIIQQDRDGAGVRVRNQEVRPAIVIYVNDGDEARALPNGYYLLRELE